MGNNKLIYMNFFLKDGVHSIWHSFSIYIREPKPRR